MRKPSAPKYDLTKAQKAEKLESLPINLHNGRCKCVRCDENRANKIKSFKLFVDKFCE